MYSVQRIGMYSFTRMLAYRFAAGADESVGAVRVGDGQDPCTQVDGKLRLEATHLFN